MSRVVVTGVGAVSPVGGDAASSFAALLEGQSGVRPISFPLDERFDVRIAGQVRALDASAALGAKDARRHGRVTQLAAVAAREALDQSGLLTTSHYDPARIACIVGVGMGGLEAVTDATLCLERRGPSRVSPYGIPALIPNMPAGAVAALAGAQGACYCTASACASSAHAIGEAMRLLRTGEADVAICGGAEACVVPVAIACFSRMGALSRRADEPARASRPFARDRDGFVLAEGAGMIVLEREESARKRGAPLFARALGYGASADAYHPTQPSPDGRGAALAMRAALRFAELRPEQVDYINAHGTGTKQNDAVETLAIKQVFGDHARQLPISSTKSMTGHMLGGAGGFEAVISILSLQRGIIAPTINLDERDPDCDLDFVPHEARAIPLRIAASNSFGFGGQNACLIFGSTS